MVRYASDRTLRALTLARLIGNYPAAAYAVALLAVLVGWIDNPAPVAAWVAVAIALGLLALGGHLADREILHREQELEREDTLGYWPCRGEREAWDEFGPAELPAEPQPVDDEGNPVR